MKHAIAIQDDTDPTVTVEVETPAGATATADASDTLTRRSSRVDTTVRKIISPDTIYATPGATALLTLPAQVAPLPPAVVNSTVGAKTLVVRDDDAGFWAKFDPKSIIATDVPANSTLTVKGYDGSTWSDIAGGVGIVGPATLNLTLPAGIQGLEFTSVPTRPSSRPRIVMPIALMSEPCARTTEAMRPSTIRPPSIKGVNRWRKPAKKSPNCSASPW